jgi:anti-sigma factor RsiW
MSCKTLLREVSNYLDADIEPAVRQQLEEHIAKCPECYVVLDTTRKTVEIYQGCEPYPIPTTLQTRLRDALRKHCEESESK